MKRLVCSKNTAVRRIFVENIWFDQYGTESVYVAVLLQKEKKKLHLSKWITKYIVYILGKWPYCLKTDKSMDV